MSFGGESPFAARNCARVQASAPGIKPAMIYKLPLISRIATLTVMFLWMTLACGKRPTVSSARPKWSRATSSRALPAVRHVPRLTASSVESASIWPVPGTAEVLSGNARSRIMISGRPDAKADTRHVSMVLRFVRYDRAGKVVSYTPEKILAADQTIQPWRGIYERMSPGEVRRLWIQDRDKEVAIYDIELLGYVGSARTEPPSRGPTK